MRQESREAAAFGSDERLGYARPVACAVAWGESVRLKRPMRPLGGSVRLKRLKGPISSVLHGGSAKLPQIADNTQQGQAPRQERPPV
jgi:hypothetical protein